MLVGEAFRPLLSDKVGKRPEGGGEGMSLPEDKLQVNH